MGRGELKVKDVNEGWFVWRMAYSTCGLHDTPSQGIRLLPLPVGQPKIFRETVCAPTSKYFKKRAVLRQTIGTQIGIRVSFRGSHSNAISRGIVCGQN